MNFKGVKRGFIFFILSILLTLTFVGPIYIPMFAESIGQAINDIFKIGNISGTTFFYTCMTIFSVCLTIYIYSLFKKIDQSLSALTIFFISIFLFFNAALFYYDIRLPNSHIDGQQIFDSIDKPIKTSLLYLILGIGHDFLIYRIEKRTHNISQRHI